MPADTDAVTSKDVRKSAKKVLEGEKVETVEAPKAPSAFSEMEEDAREKMAQEKVAEVMQDDSDKFLLKMERPNASWTTREQVVFTTQHPFQLVSEGELDELLDEGGFRRADPREVVNFYKNS